MGQNVDGVNTQEVGVMASKRMRINADGSITWQALYRIDGRQASRTYETQKACETFLKLADQLGIEEALRIDDEIATVTNAPLLADYAHDDVDLRTGISDRTRADYHRQIDRDWTGIGSIPIDRVNANMVRAWVRSLEKSGATGKTIANKHGLLASVFKSAINDDSLEVERNPCAATKLPRPDSGEEEMVFLTQAEFAVLLDYVPPPYQPFVTFLAATGLRFGEAVALRVTDWQPESARYGAVSVSKALKRTPKGFEVGRPKTRRSNRTVPVAPQLALLLNEQAEGRAGDSLLFPNPSTGGFIKHAMFHRHVWQAAVNLANGLPAGRPKESGKPTERSMFYGIEPAKVGLGKFPRIHSLRHTAASWMLETTGDIQAVQYMLGHESITTTVDRYGHLVPRRQEAIAEGMRAALATILPEIEAADVEVLELEA